MRYFVFVQHTEGPNKDWSLEFQGSTLREVKVYMNDREAYPTPAEWNFLVIKGRQLPVGFQAVVKF